jgi:gliding motility-associated-like protein
MWFRNLLIIVLFITSKAYSQQDVDFHLNGHFLNGKIILKIKRDFNDPYVWVLAKDNVVYRINSITKATEDYSAKFSGYGSLKFIDIAGQNGDVFFIATNENIVIQYKNGAIKLIDGSTGLTDKVNDIGFDYNKIFLAETANVLLIGTVNGLYRYNTDTENLILNSNKTNSQVFDASYRKLMFSGTYYIHDTHPDSVQYLPAAPFGDRTLFASFVWLGGKSFGNTINTAYYTSPMIYDFHDYASYMNLFWGNDRGMFQINGNASYNSARQFKHYLNNITVNKISGIYGLTSFGNGHAFFNPGIIKETLLIGTNSGLYFSSSVYDYYGNNDQLNNFTLFHYDELGNVQVNDISVNALSTTEPVCEDGVWLATNNGVYLIKPDYAKYLNAEHAQLAAFKGKGYDIKEEKVCQGESAHLLADPFSTGTSAIQWFKDGVEMAGESNNDLATDKSGDYYAILYDPCQNIHFESNHLKVKVISLPVFSFDYPTQLTFCEGAISTLKVTGGPAYQYRWYKDGVLTGDVNAELQIINSGEYKVEVSACENSWIPSKEVQMDFISLPSPVIKADKNAYCIGEQVVLDAGVLPGNGYQINWIRDGLAVNEWANQNKVSTNLPGNYSVLISSDKLAGCNKVSAIIPVTFKPIPEVNILQTVKTSLCEGQSVELKAEYSGSKVKWSTGETSDKIIVTASGTYSVTTFSDGGCTADAGIPVQFHPVPVLTMKDTSICVSSMKHITITAPAGFVKYVWNSQNGTNSYQADHPQQVTLTVTDENGCEATRDITITDECPDASIPNAFSPNGDGINDTWVIKGFENDPAVVVSVFNRYGTKLFESKGYRSPWNGKFNGKMLPPGAYYYMISPNNKRKTLSGNVTIMY